MSDQNANTSSLTDRHFGSARDAKLQAEVQAEIQAEQCPPHQSNRLAFTDDDFMMQDELRHVRLQLEYLKPEMQLCKHQINATVVVFGSARTLAPEIASMRLTQAQQQLNAKPDDVALKQAVALAKRQVRTSRYYQQAQQFAELVTQHNQQFPRKALTIASGGGPGIMEAANRGAQLAGGKSIGFNIVLPHEQVPNPYITPELSFQFHYFAIRKMHFLQRAQALLAFPGGFGTLDELFETLTLLQTGKANQVPVLLFDEQFWRKLINFELLVEEGFIAAEDMQLIQFVDSATAAWQIIVKHYQLPAAI